MTKDKAIILKSCFLAVLNIHINIITDEVFNLFDECTARCAHLHPQGK